MGVKGIGRCLIVLLLASCTTVWSAELKGRSSTQLLWFNNEFDQQRQVDLVEYLRLSVLNVDKAGKLSFYGYGRGVQDLNNGEGNAGRLYYLYGDYNNVYDKLDTRLGRQFIGISAGSAIIDGAQFELHDVGHVAFTLLGGRQVFFTENGERGRAGDFAVGAAASLAGIKAVDAELSWLRNTDGWDPARDTLGAMFRTYMFGNMKSYGNAKYDVASETLSELQLGLKYFPLHTLEFTTEWYQSYPTFDATSIYSVFAVDRFQEFVVSSVWAASDRIVANVGYRRQSYGDQANANVYEAGLKLRPIDPVVIGLYYDKRQGYGGDLDGAIADVTWDVSDALQLATGLTYDVYQRDEFDHDETARKYWGGGRYKLAKNLSTSLRIENNVNARYHNNMQGRFAVDYDF
jgi:hypothetical protein